MKDTETKNRFVELRATGLSFSAIAKQLKVSKQTLINWSKIHQDDILNLKAIETEAIREKYCMTEKARIKMVGKQLEKIKAELDKRDLTEVPTATLLSFFMKYVAILEKEDKSISFTKYEGELEIISLDGKKTWSV